MRGIQSAIDMARILSVRSTAGKGSWRIDLDVSPDVTLNAIEGLCVIVMMRKVGSDGA